ELETVSGVFQEVACVSPRGAQVKFAIAGGALRLVAPDLEQIEFRAQNQASTLAANPCSQWKGRKARVRYKTALREGFTGEILSIDFD
ncbi:MAG: hypothetical protein ACRD3T_21870, partial [Terriglobia bacterium]